MHDLIVFGEDFGGLPSSTQHLVKRLASQRKIVWVNSIGLRQPKLNSGDIKRAFNKLLGKQKSGFGRTGTTNANHNMTIVDLKTIPAPDSAFARQVAKELMLRQLLPVIRKAQLRQPILWCSLPTAADLCGHLGESAVVYYCGDDFEALAGVDHHIVAKHEANLVEKADLIFGASEEICRKFPAAKTQLLPHGVDTELFSSPALRAHDLPNNGRPTAGFYGSLSEWLDYEMLHAVVEQNPEWNFVFIGPQELSKSQLPTATNVHYLGPKPHHELPGYSQHWDVSLLPFKSNRQIEACSPLKLMEYLAAETPIVSTQFPALAPFKRYVHVVDGAEEMTAALKHARYQPRLPKGIVTQHSWDSRSEFVNWMLELL
ncbi:glycosyltransferase [Vibrio sp. SCSIO 43135]|uniref:glycosyltransferase n=1 Tax=Vibrio sp. SCSIO 43135 TaxID=2819096 RepID=UPI0020764415|nr:glycosyltransferase [Vibrio sp. SCSIO 43135]USD39952.1 glycosyltransferase [Vibrio sp. SCSIO 43135]